MEELLIKTIPTVGSAGLLSAVLWKIATRFMDETVKQTSNRIDSLEKHIEICDRERKELYDKIYELATRLNSYMK